MALTEQQRAYHRQYAERRRRARGQRTMAETRKGIAPVRAMGETFNMNRRIRRRALRRQEVGPVPRVEFGLAVGRLIGRKLRFKPVKSRARGRTKGLRGRG